MFLFQSESIPGSRGVFVSGSYPSKALGSKVGRKQPKKKIYSSSACVEKKMTWLGFCEMRQAPSYHQIVIMISISAACSPDHTDSSSPSQFRIGKKAKRVIVRICYRTLYFWLRIKWVPYTRVIHAQNPFGPVSCHFPYADPLSHTNCCQLLIAAILGLYTGYNQANREPRCLWQRRELSKCSVGE